MASALSSGCETHSPQDAESGYQCLGDNYDPLSIDDVRQRVVERKETAVVPLCYAALQHASDGITHSDQKIVVVCKTLGTISKDDARKIIQQGRQLVLAMVSWMVANPITSTLMVVGLGGTAYEANTIAELMEGKAQRFTDWGRSTTTTMRFVGFCGLMTVRLLVSTLVPPTSPAFGIILQAATPESEKWTAMPFFLAASAVAGAVPYTIDKVIQLFSQTDFMFTNLMRKFVEAWPLTCWTWPAMNKVFQSAGGGKMGASLAVIVAHAAPFMGAQTTIMQRYFLPHPLDSIISQPFGMSEDLLTMAMAEATSNPRLGSASLTVLITGFNLVQFAIFSGFADLKAMACALLNIVVGVFVACMLQGVPANIGLAMVGLQLVVQVSGVPFITRAFIKTSEVSAGRSAGPNPQDLATSTLSTPRSKSDCVE